MKYFCLSQFQDTYKFYHEISRGWDLGWGVVTESDPKSEVADTSSVKLGITTSNA